MPCGGIYPCNQKIPYPCLHCNKEGADCWVEEWDAPIHSACVRDFLKGPEGEVILEHRHIVRITEDGKPVTLYEEGCDAPTS